MSDVFKATKNKQGSLNSKVENEKVFKATEGKEITDPAKYSLSMSLNNLTKTPTKSDWGRIAANQTLKKVQNGEYVSPEAIESAAKTIEAQAEGWAAHKNPTTEQLSGRDIAANLRTVGSDYSLFKDDKDFKNNKENIDKQIEYYSYSNDEVKTRLSDGESKRATLESEISALNKELAELKKKKAEWSGNKGVAAAKKQEYQNRIREIEKQLEGKQKELGDVGIAYRNTDGSAVTWKNIYNGKLSSQFKVKNEDGSYRGLTYDEVQEKLKGYDPESDEYKFLSSYTDYSDLNEFYKAFEKIADKDSDYYAELKKAKNIYELDHKFDLYKHYTEAEDFEEKSKYVSTKTGSKKYYGKEYGVYADSKYEYINGNVEAVQSEILEDPESNSPTYAYKNYDQLTDEEVKVYNYLYAQDKDKGTAKADEFLKDMEITLGKRANDTNKTNIEKLVAESSGIEAVIHNLQTIALKPIASFGSGLQNAAAILSGEELNPYATGNLLSNAISDFRQAQSEEIVNATQGAEFLGQNIPSFLYNTAMSMGDSVVGAALFGEAGTVLMGADAFQQTAREMKEVGEDNGTILAMATASGIAEMLFEYVEVDNLFKNIDGGLSPITAFVKQGLVESFGEGATEVTNIISDSLLRGKNSELYKTYARLKEEGKTDSEIATALAKQVGGQVGWAMAGGFLSGGAMGGVGAIGNHNKMSSAGKIITKNNQVMKLIEAGLSLNPDSAAYKTASEIGKSKNVTNAQIGKLASDIKQATAEQKSQITKNAVVNRAQELGASSKEASKLANFFVSTAYGEEVSSEGIANTSFAKQIAGEIKDGSATWVAEMNSQIEAAEEIEQVVTDALTKKYVSPAENSELQSSANDGVSSDVDGYTSSAEQDSAPSPQGEGNGQSGTPVPTENNQGSGVFNNNKRHRVDKAEQDAVLKVCKALGIKAQFEHITRKTIEEIKGEKYDGELPDGYYDPNTKTIHLGFAAVNPIKFVFKHELTHFGEGTEAYKKFVKAVKKSKEFNNWLEKVVGKEGKTKTLSKEYQNDISKNYSENTNLEAEMIADFVGSALFTENGSGIEAMLSDLDVNEQKSVLQYLLDFLKYLKNKLSGNKDIASEISRLEDSFNRMLSEAVQTQKNTAENSGVKYSMAEDKNLYKYAQDALTGKLSKKSYYKLSDKISERMAKDIEKIVGFSVKGYGNEISPGNIKHIENEHGINGRTDHSMKDHHNLARISYIIENYEKIKEGKRSTEYKNSDGSYAKTVVLQKRIDDGFYYVVEAVPDATIKTLHIVSAYINKKDTFSDEPVSNDPKRYVQDEHQSNVSSIDSIPENELTVNNNSTQEGAENSKNIKFSFARSKDTSLIDQAEQMEKDGAEREEIWAELGLTKDAGGVWVYEIDDSEMVFYPKGDIFVKDDPDYQEYLKLDGKEKLTYAEYGKLSKLDDKLFSKYEFGKPVLKNYLKHDKLYEKYPQLKETIIMFKDFRGKALGSYDAKSNTIYLDNSLQGEGKNIELTKTMIHEIQHAIQHLDGRENGSSVDFWNARLLRGERMPINPETGEEYTPEEAYWYSAGELEAREAAERFDYTENERRFGGPFAPDLKTDKAVLVSEYMSAVASGNMESAQVMVDEAAKANGYTERLYHQTGADFTEFNTDNQVAGKYDWELPTGTFLKPTDGDIGLKGQKQMELYAKIEKPLTFENRQAAQRFWSDNVPEYREAVKEIRQIDAEYRQKVDYAMADVRSYLKEWKRNHPDTDSREIYNDTEYQRLNDIEDSIVDEWEEKSNKASLKAKKLIDGFMQNSGFDGIVVTKDAGAQGRSTKTYIVFDSSQLKDASPVTYDDNGNVISLSKRFDGSKKDIRFSMPRKAGTDSQKKIASKRNSVYNEYATNVMQWANSASTHVNDVKIFNDRGKDFVLNMATEDGYIELARGHYEEVKELEHIYNTENESFDRYAETYKSIERTGDSDLWESPNGEVLGRNSGNADKSQVGTEGNFSTANVEYVRSGDKGEYVNNKADSKESAFSMPSEAVVMLNKLQAGEITDDEYEYFMDELWDRKIAEMEDQKAAQDIAWARYNNQLKKRNKRLREQLQKRRSEVVREETERREERANKQKNIEFIRREIKRLDKKLRSNTEKQHIPEEMKEMTAYFVKIFVDNDTSPFDKRDIRDIRTLYSDLIGDYNIVTGEGELKTDAFDFNVMSDMRMLENRLAGKTLRELDLWETMVVRNIVENFAHIIDWENKMFLAGKEFETDEIGFEALREIKANKTKRVNKAIDGIDGIKYSNMTPIYFFDRLGTTFKKLFRDILDGQGKCVRNWETAKTYITQLKEKYHYSEWENKTLKFTTEKGADVELTVEQAMLLYATAKREYGNKFQKAEHLFKGGIVVEPNEKTLKDIAKKFKNSDKKGRAKLYDAFTEEVNAKAVRITPLDAGRVLEFLTKEQRDYADGLVEYLSNDMAALGNEVSMQLFGIRKFNEKYYIPYNSAQNYLYSQPGVTSEARLKHQSFTKETVVKANNPLLLTDFSTVCADHINRMCMYNALTLPLENMNKIFNFKTFGTENDDAQDMKVEIERVYGQGAVNYIKQFLNDVNGNLQVSSEDKFLNRWMSKFKKGAVFASASVVVQQPSAVMRAMAYINPKYFAKTTLKLRERDYQQACKYAPVAVLKEMGRFDTGVGMATTKWLLQEKPKGAKNIVKALFDVKDSSYRDDKLSWFAAKADEITWAHIWAATKAEIADTTDLKVGSEEFLQACGERFTEVINYTQVYDSTISRSQIMRNKSAAVQMLTAFMSEPTVSLNLLMNAVHEAKSGTKKGWKYAGGAVGAFIGNVVLNALLKSLVTAGRDDDEEKTYGEKYIESFWDEMANSINPLTMIPFVKDIVSIFQGYTIERADMNLFNDLADAFDILDSEKKTPLEKVEKISGALAAFLGLPVKNVWRDCKTAYNIVNDIFITDKTDRQINEKVDGYMTKLDGNKTFESLDKEDREKLEENISDKVRAVDTKTENRDEFADLYEAMRKNTEKYKRMKKEMLEKGYTNEEITDGIEIARILYMKSIGIDVHEYLLYKIATNKKHADTDGSGGVTKEEKRVAVDNMDLSKNAKNYFKNKHK